MSYCSIYCIDWKEQNKIKNANKKIILGRSGGQVVRRSKIESHWSLQIFSVKCVFEKNKNKQKEAGVGPLKKILRTVHCWPVVYWVCHLGGHAGGRLCFQSVERKLERPEETKLRTLQSCWLARMGRSVEKGRLGLVVMGGDSCSRGRGFELQHCILDGLF